MSEQTNTEETKVPTEKEIKEHRTAMENFYKSELPMLKSRLEYETLLTEIEKQKLIRVESIARQAMIMYPPGSQETPATNNQEEAPKQKTEKKLKSV
jgi:hypothetical protein